MCSECLHFASCTPSILFHLDFYFCSSDSSLSQGYVESVDEMEEDLQTLQFLQWTMPQFCINVIKQAVSVLSCVNEQVVMETMKLLQEVAKILGDIVYAELLWSDPSLTAKEMVVKLCHIIVHPLCK